MQINRKVGTYLLKIYCHNILNKKENKKSSGNRSKQFKIYNITFFIRQIIKQNITYFLIIKKM